MCQYFSFLVYFEYLAEAVHGKMKECGDEQYSVLNDLCCFTSEIVYYIILQLRDLMLHIETGLDTLIILIGLLVCKIPLLARALGLKAAPRPSACATIGYLVYNRATYHSLFTNR